VVDAAPIPNLSKDAPPQLEPKQNKLENDLNTLIEPQSKFEKVPLKEEEGNTWPTLHILEMDVGHRYQNGEGEEAEVGEVEEEEEEESEEEGEEEGGVAEDGLFGQLHVPVRVHLHFHVHLVQL